MKQQGRLFSAIATGALALPAIAQDAQSPDALEEILVTAERRQESLQRAPVSVTAISGDSLQQRQITDTKQVVFNVPNLTGNNNVGQSSAAAFFIRGVGTTENLVTADTSVGLYVDDVYIGRQAVNNFGLLDIERIEVLRGPQGTLYGRNTNGGAIKIVSKAPDEDPEFSAKASFGNYDRWDLRLSGNTPVSDRVFVRANFLTQQGDGYIRNVTLGKDVNDIDYIGGRVALRAIVTDDLEFTFAVDGSRDQQNGGYAADIAGVLRPPTGDLYEVVSGLDARGDGETYGVSGTFDWTVAEGYTLKSITAYRSTNQFVNLDLSDQPVPLYNLVQYQDAKQFSQEYQLTGALTDNLDFIAGLYYFDEDGEADLTDFTRTSAVSPQSRFTKAYDVTTSSYAVFGQLDYEIGKWTFSAGGRYTRDERELDITQTSSVPGPLFNYDTASLAALGAAGQNIDPKRRFSKTTPRVGVDYQINEDLFTYVSYTEGFRSGGWTGRVFRSDQYINFDPEEVTSYEAGLKATFFDGRARLNTSVFFMEYENLFNTLTVAGVYSVQTANAEIQGLEAEFTLRALSWLDLYANVGLADTKYTGTRPVNLAPELQRSPAVQGKVGFSAQYPVADGTLVATTDVFYTDEYYATPANLSFTAPLLPPALAQTGDFTLVSASVGYRWDDDRYEVLASCTNCLDEEYFEAANYIGPYAAAYPGAPRLYKLGVGVRF